MITLSQFFAFMFIFLFPLFAAVAVTPDGLSREEDDTVFLRSYLMFAVVELAGLLLIYYLTH